MLARWDPFELAQTKTLGMTYIDIAKKLNIDPRTVRKSCLFNLKKNPSPLRGEGLGEGDSLHLPPP